MNVLFFTLSRYNPLFNLDSGIALLQASVVAGWLWQSYGAAMAFCVGAVFSMAALLLLLIRR